MSSWLWMIDSSAVIKDVKRVWRAAFSGDSAELDEPDTMRKMTGRGMRAWSSGVLFRNLGISWRGLKPHKAGRRQRHFGFVIWV